MGAMRACTAALSTLLAAGAADAQDLLLVPDAWEDRVMAFSPADGTLLDVAFVPDPGEVDGLDVLVRPWEVIDSGRGTLLVTDQIKAYVVEFDYDGNFLGVFVDRFAAGDPMFFTRGIALMPDGTLAVCNQGEEIQPVAHSVLRFDDTGAHAGWVVPERYGGIEVPTSIEPFNGDLLVASAQRDFIARYRSGEAFDDIFARHSLINEPLQMTATNDGHLLVATFAPPAHILEFDAAGDLVDSWRVDFTSGYRGVAELDNGNLLITCTQGVMEVTRDGTFVEWAYNDGTTGFFYYINRVTLPGAAAASPAPAPPLPRPVARTAPPPARGAAGGPPSNNDLLVIERTGYQDLACKEAGTIGSFPAADPADLVQVADAGELKWVGMDVHPITGALYGFELTTNSVRRLEPGGGNTLIDSVGLIDDMWYGGMTFNNDGSMIYICGTTGSYTRVLEVAAVTAEVLEVHDYFGVLFHGLAVVPENALGLPAGALWVTRAGSLVSDLALLELDLETDLANFIEPLLIDSNGDVGLDFAPDATLYLSANPFSSVFGIGPAELHEIDPTSFLEIEIGTIGDPSCPWDAGSIAVATAPAVDCPGDVDLDGTVGTPDFLLLLAAWGGTEPLADLDGDGTVGTADLLMLLANWGPCPS